MPVKPLLLQGRDYVDVTWLEMVRSYTAHEKREYLNTLRLCGDANRAMIVALEVALNDGEKILPFASARARMEKRMEKIARSSAYGRNSSGGDDVA